LTILFYLVYNNNHSYLHLIIMYICICNAVTDKDIEKAIDNGACSMNDLSKQLKVGTCCGRCKSCAKKMLNKSQSISIQTLNIPSLKPNIAFA